jgi:bile acid:Na+ symporter, BASS family
MTFADLIPIAIKLSIVLLVFALGLRADWRDAVSLFRQPRLLVRSILAMAILMIAFVVAIASVFDLRPPVRIAILALAISPVPPLLPNRQQIAGGSHSYAIGLMVAAALIAIVLMPFFVAVLGGYFDAETHMAFRQVAAIVAVSVIAPLAAGMFVRYVAPEFAGRIVKPVSIFANVLLVVAALIVLFNLSEPIWRMIGHGVLVVLALFTLVGIAIGHFLGGPNPDDRTVLALATGIRHPGLAMAIASVNFPDQKIAVLAVVVCHVLVGLILSIPYLIWRKRSHAGKSATTRRNTASSQ